jgi:MoaE-MoaD fusion protein
MKAKVLFFGISHDVTGISEEVVECRDNTTLTELWSRYVRRFSRLSDLTGTMVAAVNQDVKPWTHRLKDGDEVAFMPPVSGGAPEDLCRITRECIPTAELAASMKAPEDGAVVVFEGIVRNNSRGRETLYLEYEGYEPMALRKMQEIRREIEDKWPIDQLAIVHRLGRLEIGEVSVAIVVTSAHRRAAFEACHYAIDRLKQIVPIWKKEFFADGAVWAEGEGQTKILVEAHQAR